MVSLEERIERLIYDFFPAGTAGIPYLPGTAGRRLAVERWLVTETRPFGALATALVARVFALLQELEADARGREGHRHFARIDASELTKRPASILEKMAREWAHPETASPPIDFSNFHHKLNDLGRFRIVTNFLSDAEAVAEAIEAPLRPGPAAALTPAQRALASDFSLDDNRFEKGFHRIGDESGERCCKGWFYRRGEPSRKIEIQIQTQLQEAWDKKEHYLVYEPRRRSETVSPRHISELNAMSALLYIADCSFDRLRHSVLSARAGK